MAGIERHAQRYGRAFGLPQLGVVVLFAARENRYPFCLRNRSLEKLQTLGGERRFRDEDPGDVSTGLRKARHESLRHGCAGKHDDRNGLGRIPCRPNGFVPDRDDHVDSRPRQVSREAGQTLGLATGEPPIHEQVPVLGVSQLLECSGEQERHVAPIGRRRLGDGLKDPDPRCPPRGLCFGGQRRRQEREGERGQDAKPAQHPGSPDVNLRERMHASTLPRPRSKRQRGQGAADRPRPRVAGLGLAANQERSAV